MSESKELVNYDELLAEMAKQSTAVERPTGASIGTRAGVLTYNGNPCAGNKLDVIVVASAFANLYYDKKFDADHLTSPVCFAYGVQEPGETAADVEAKMAPHPASAKPQAERCSECPRNAWKSDPDGGKGKACKNTRSLAVIPAGTKPEEIATAEIAILRPPVTSVKAWQMYVQKCDALYKRPPLAVITQVGSVPDQKTQYKLTFTDMAVVDKGMIKGLIDRIPAAIETACKVYDPPEEEPAEEGEAKAKKF